MTSARLGTPLAFLLLAAGCGGTSVSHGGDDDSAGTSGAGKGGSGGTSGGTGGTSAGGTGGGAGGTKGGNFGGGTGGDAGGTKGGTTSVGGSSSGAGGAAGSAGCTPGQRCDFEGVTCSTDSCCSCQSTCKNGVWQNLICPPCAAPICPPLPPGEGDMCDMCQVPSEGCSWDECAFDGPRSAGHCDGLHWVITSSSCAPNGCCTRDTDCAPEAHCLPGGTCAPAGRYGACWVDADCGAEELCSGAFACGCGVVCGTANTIGACVPKGIGCCATDQDCPEGHECVVGQCELKLNPNNGCWTDRDCSAGGQCLGASVCGCGASCLVANSPGMCVVPL